MVLLVLHCVLGLWLHRVRWDNGGTMERSHGGGMGEVFVFCIQEAERRAEWGQGPNISFTGILTERPHISQALPFPSRTIGWDKST